MLPERRCNTSITFQNHIIINYLAEKAYVYVHLCNYCILIAHGNWGSWGRWSSCSKTCGGGTKIRRRICRDLPTSNGEIGCKGNHYTRSFCNTFNCPGNKSYKDLTSTY